MNAAAVDAISLNFNSGTLTALNAVIGLMMFGMALDLKLEDFSRIIKSPKGPLIGLAAQVILLPAFTFLLTLVIPAAPSMLLGMMLVAACPGGNFSNVLTYLAKGNAALSISMTAVSTAVAIFMTPLNLSFWGSLHPATEPILHSVSLDPFSVFKTIILILGLPLALGLTVSRLYPRLVKKVRGPFKVISVVFFLAFVGMALAVNWQNFVAVIGLVAFGVFVHNALALSLGYSSARALGLPKRDCRAVSIEVGIQNSALGLILIFNFFDGLGGMAVVAAWWGIWHIIAGLTVAFFWSRSTLPQAEQEVSV